MVHISLASAADRAFTTMRAVRERRPLTGRLARRASGSPSAELDLTNEPNIADEANWLDLDLAEQIAFDEKLSLFLDLEIDVEDKERAWLLPNG